MPQVISTSAVLPLRSGDTSNLRPSPVLAFIGRKNSGKTTLLVKLISELANRGVDVATLKHHGHPQFEIDVPGKDSFMHRQAGAQATAVMSSDIFALIQNLPSPSNLYEALPYLDGHDVILVEGFRNVGVPYVEIMRAASPRDVDYVDTFKEILKTHPDANANRPVAAVSDIPAVQELCEIHDLPCFDPDAIEPLANFVQERFVRADLGIVIQAGGESKRMGQSKALVPFNGRPLIQRMAERLAPLADDLVITTNEPESLAFLPEKYPCIRLAQDETEERGALPGLLTALKNTRTDHVAVIACDMVNVSPRMIATELALLQAAGVDAVVPKTKHGLEPLSGVYLTKPFLAAAQATHNAGETRLKQVLARMNVLEIQRDNPWGIHFPLGCFMNVNTPDELAFAEKMLDY